MLGSGIVLLAALAWTRRFMLDDAFIALRYAEHFVAGHGLVWNIGERVEGYTSFLWTVLLAIPLALRWDPVSFVHGLGPVLLAGSLSCTALLAWRVMASRSGVLAVTVMLGLNASFSAFATGGLETQLLTLLLTALFAVTSAKHEFSNGQALVASLLTASCLLTRLDAALPVSAAWWHLASVRMTQPQTRRQVPLRLAMLCVPCAAVVGAWLAWKVAFYGSAVPNTLQAKASVGGGTHGVHFLTSFYRSYILWPCLLPVALTLPQALRGGSPVRPMLVALLAVYVYIVAVGGDFMEYRFLVPTLPLFFTCLGWALWEATERAWLRASVVAFVAMGSAHHRATFKFEDGIESVAELSGHLHGPGEDWVGVGKRLRDSLPPNSDVKIAVSAAGAVPYYSGLPAVDMFGLTDLWTAQHGFPIKDRIGHARLAPLSHLRDLGVHLVVGHPVVSPRLPANVDSLPFDTLARFPMLTGASRATVPKSAALMEVPLDGNRVLRALYLQPHPDIDRAVERARWRRIELVR